MVTLSPTAIEVLDQLRQADGVPPSYGLRLDGVPAPDGGLQIRMEFRETPEDRDEIGESAGTKVFVDENLAGPLSNALIDAQTNGRTSQLVIVQNPGT